MGELSARLRRLDLALYRTKTGLPSGVDRFLGHVVKELGSYSNRGVPDADAEVVEPTEVDNLVDRCELFKRAAQTHPDVVRLLDVTQCQHWISWTRPDFAAGRQHTFTERNFVGFEPRAIAMGRPTTKPSAGLYTSTVFRDSESMWLDFLRINEWSTLFRKPWHIWQVRALPPARVYEAETAQSWQRLVECNGIRAGNFVYPDWAALARRYDAIHVGLRTVIGLNGFAVTTAGREVIAPTNWDTECTFWLNWCFGDPELILIQQ